MTFTPRPYQTAAIDAGLNFFNEKKQYNALQILPTGSGKSIVVANLGKGLEGKTIVFQPSKEILNQNYAKYISYGYRAGIYSASAGHKFIDKITFATIGSVAKKHHLFRDVKHIIIDECFPFDQYISTENGKVKIGAIFNLMQKGINLPKALSYNEKTGDCEFKKIISARCNGEKDILRLRFSKNVFIKSTPEHPFLTTQGWKNASQLKPGDCVLSSSPNGTYANILNPDQESIILGGILGDGSVDSLRKIKNINRFRFVQGAEQEKYLRWKAEILKSKVREVLKNGFAEKKAFAFSTPVCFFDDDHCTKEYAISALTAQSFAISWMDDGHIAKLENQGSLYATATSKPLTIKLLKKLRGFGINGKLQWGASSISNNTYYYIKFNKHNVEKISEIVAPFIHPSMGYKVCKKDLHNVGTHNWSGEFNKRGALVFLDSEKSKSEPVYNLQIEDNETYVLTSKRYDKNHKSRSEGVIVHNCHLVNSEAGMYFDFIKSLPEAKVLGLTATPYRLCSYVDGAMLKFLTRTRPKIFNKVNYYIQNSVLFDAGHLAKLEYFSFDTIERGRLQMNTSGTDFTEASLKAHYREIDMVGKTINYGNRLLVKRKNLLIFCTMISEAQQVAKGIPGAVVLTGETESKERDSILSKFKSGVIKCVVNVGVLTTGFDYPELECVLMARSTMSLALYYQIVGRAMRPHPNKNTAWIVDLGGNVNFFGKIETMEIREERGLHSIWNNGRQLTNVSFVKK